MALFKYFSSLSDFQFAQDTNIVVAAMNTTIAEVQHVTKDKKMSSLSINVAIASFTSHVHVLVCLSKERALENMLQNMATQLL